MHGNTQTSTLPPFHKTRHMSNLISELLSSLKIHKSLNSRLGGVHLELTGDITEDGLSVTECLGGSMRLEEESLGLRFESHCDPRLNFEQSLGKHSLRVTVLRIDRLISRVVERLQISPSCYLKRQVLIEEGNRVRRITSWSRNWRVVQTVSLAENLHPSSSTVTLSICNHFSLNSQIIRTIAIELSSLSDQSTFALSFSRSSLTVYPNVRKGERKESFVIRQEGEKRYT